jgi:signal transduction histidine kinase
MMTIQAQSKGIELNLVVDELNHYQIKSDPNRIKQILLNLISNALKFCEPKKGKIIIEATKLRYFN